ncbi:MAG: spore cortex biosynthesis protein YabQ [Muribaculum sp.]|nr:spore cortex biosynthesis protein YabQ [Muribaculum sp.]
MASENEFLLYALFMGIFITFVYDILRILRRVFPHGSFLVSLEDILFWIYCTVRVFLLMHRESNGTLRWFAILGALAGMLLYKKLVSPPLVKYVSRFLRWIVRMAASAVRFVLRPFAALWRQIRVRAARAARRRAVKIRKKKEIGRRILKKKLTYAKKLLKINVKGRKCHGKRKSTG